MWHGVRSSLQTRPQQTSLLPRMLGKETPTAKTVLEDLLFTFAKESSNIFSFSFRRFVYPKPKPKNIASQNSFVDLRAGSSAGMNAWLALKRSGVQIPPSPFHSKIGPKIWVIYIWIYHHWFGVWLAKHQFYFTSHLGWALSYFWGLRLLIDDLQDFEPSQTNARLAGKGVQKLGEYATLQVFSY